jgi:tetratricopeptide (TPR) repeat protein
MSAARLRTALGLLLVAALCAAAWVQVGYWRDPITFYERVLEIAPNAYRPHARLAALYARNGQIEKARLHFERAVEIDPAQGREGFVAFELDSADLALQQVDLDTAVECWREALRVDPEQLRANRQLGLVLAARKQAAEARPLLEKALREEPPDARVRVVLARYYVADGRLGVAVALLREAVRIEPELTAARNDLAWLLATAADASLRSPEEALQLAESIGRVDQLSSANLLDTLAAAYAAAGRHGDAVRAAERALTLAQGEDAQLAPQIESRLREYRRGRAWVEPLPASAAAGNGADPSTQR